MDKDRRVAFRYSFTAQAELIDELTSTRVVSRVCDLSLYGCRLEMANPFPDDSLATLRITVGNDTFQASVRMIYSHANASSGVEFVDVKSEDQALLERWLAQAATP